MGYVIHVGDIEMESMDHESNDVHVDIYLEPSLGKRNYSAKDIITEIVEIDYHDEQYLKDK
jgi:hypothetical protein